MMWYAWMGVAGVVLGLVSIGVTWWTRVRAWRRRAARRAERMELVLCAAIVVSPECGFAIKDGWFRSEDFLFAPEDSWGRYVICGWRHHQCIELARSVGMGRPSSFEQGFLTSHNRYVDRREAARIAVAAGQVTELRVPLSHWQVCPGDLVPELFSEDLY